MAMWSFPRRNKSLKVSAPTHTNTHTFLTPNQCVEQGARAGVNVHALIAFKNPALHHHSPSVHMPGRYGLKVLWHCLGVCVCVCVCVGGVVLVHYSATSDSGQNRAPPVWAQVDYWPLSRGARRGLWWLWLKIKSNTALHYLLATGGGLANTKKHTKSRHEITNLHNELEPGAPFSGRSRK